MFSGKRGRKSNEVASIFVHAGAGYHSVQNENVHLQACNDSAKAAMAVLRGGGSAVDAVELAVKVLEDREITNSGYGSNLAMDGVVECDAVVIDHTARSGAAGAVAQIKNPISLARLLLDHTTQPLSLRRVPPNMLVGQGATDFAYEHGMPVVPHDHLISPAARDRWRRWRDDLDRAERNRRREAGQSTGMSPPPSQSDLVQYYTNQSEHEQARKAHENALRTGVWNEAQPMSPPPSDNAHLLDNSSSPNKTNSSYSMDLEEDTSETTLDSREEYTDPYGPPGMFMTASKNPFSNSTQKMPTPPLFAGLHSPRGSDGGFMSQLPYGTRTELSDLDEPDMLLPQMHFQQPVHLSGRNDGSSGSESDTTIIAPNHHPQTQSLEHSAGVEVEDPILFSQPDTPDDKQSELYPPFSANDCKGRSQTQPPPPERHLIDKIILDNARKQDDDLITDTVGAIAVDMYGNIACAASSGGIGMKHRGRIGPAALVRIGAAVVPIEPEDAERTTVATVTSGTGEHMATTNAANTCSDRVYHGIRKVPGGCYEECTEDEALKRFIEKDFMAHPSVQHSHSTGAIGVLSVKKTKDGSYLFYAHNTDSFALASMHSDETKPVCTMSRSKGNGVIAQGGRAIRNKKRKA